MSANLPRYADLYADVAKAYPAVLYNDFHLTKLTLLVRSGLRYKSKRAFLVIERNFQSAIISPI